MINQKGELRFAEFRTDTMEGKVTHQRTLSKLETDKIFKAMVEWNDQFISVAEKAHPIPSLSSTRPHIMA